MTSAPLGIFSHPIELSVHPFYCFIEIQIGGALRRGPTVHGTTRVGRAVKGKEIGEVVVTLTRNTETTGLDGVQYPHPRVEPRLTIEVLWDGRIVAFSHMPADQFAEQVEIMVSGFVGVEA